MAIFVDTGAWYAASVPSDADHAVAKAFIASNAEAFVTSDYIYDELLTLFRSRGQMNRAKEWVEKLRIENCEIVRVKPDDIELLSVHRQRVELHGLCELCGHGTTRDHARVRV